MKAPEEVKREATIRWLGKADDDLGAAELLLSRDEVFANASAFHSPQAAEKYLKAFLTWRQTAFPKTHDLEARLDEVPYRKWRGSRCFGARRRGQTQASAGEPGQGSNAELEWRRQ